MTRYGYKIAGPNSLKNQVASLKKEVTALKKDLSSVHRKYSKCLAVLSYIEQKLIMSADLRYRGWTQFGFNAESMLTYIRENIK